MDDLSLDILTLKNKYFTEFNIILDEKDGEEYHYIDFNDDNYNIEKYILQFCNFNVFYDKMLGFVNQENEKMFLLKDIEKDLIWMITENWNELKNELINKNIREIQIFFNIIFPKLFQKLKNAENFNTNQKRIEFERSINALV